MKQPEVRAWSKAFGMGTMIYITRERQFAVNALIGFVHIDGEGVTYYNTIYRDLLGMFAFLD